MCSLTNLSTRLVVNVYHPECCLKVPIIFLTADGIPHEVGVVFAKDVFSSFCHFQENHGY